MKNGADLSASPDGLFKFLLPLRHLRPLLGRSLAQLFHAADIDLADPFLRDAEVVADLFEGHFAAAVHAGPHLDDFASPRVEVLQ